MKNKIMIIGLFLCGVIGFQVAAAGIWNEELAVHIRPQEIEDATLVIGSHLIYLGALTEELYAVAKDSAEDSGQREIYYKSELASGAWFSITTASTLEDITTGGTPVEDKVIAALFFTHHTKSDGVTYDLRTGQPVNIFDIQDPYDLEAMPELMPLKTHYDMMKELQADTKEGKIKIARAEEFFATKVENEKTQEWDEILEALQIYLDVLRAYQEGAAEISVVEGVMEAVDGARRAIVFQIVQDELISYSLEQSGASDRQEREEDEESQSQPTADTQLLSAIADSISNVESALIHAEGKMLDEGATVLSAQVYRVSQDLCQDALAKNHTACDQDVTMLIAYENILNGVVANRERELQLLEETLLPQGEKAYTGGISAGLNQAYQAAAAQQAAAALLRGITEEYTSQVNAKRSEFEFFIEAYCMRVPNTDGQHYISQRMETAQSFYGIVKRDAFQERMENTVDKHIAYLTNKKRTLELAAGGNPLDKLIVEKEAVQKEYMKALDNNDLMEAKAVEQKLAQMDSQIAELSNSQVAAAEQLQNHIKDLQKQLNDIIHSSQAEADSANSPGNQEASIANERQAETLRQQIAAKRAELTALQASMPENTLGGVVASLKTSCLDAVKGQKTYEGGSPVAGSQSDGASAQNMGNLSSNIDALGGLLDENYKTVFPALQEIYEAMVTARNLKGASQFDEEIAKIEERILHSNSAYKAAMMEEKDGEALADEAERFFTQRLGGLLDGIAREEIAQGIPGAEQGSTGGRQAGISSGIGNSSPSGTGTGGTPESPFDSNDNMQGLEREIAGVENILGLSIREDKSPRDLSQAEKQAVEMGALALYYEQTKNEDAKDLLAVIALRAEGTENSLAFSAYNDGGGEFVSVPAIARYSGMRYVWLHNQNQGVLAQGGHYYSFTGYSEQVETGDGKVEYMTRPAIKKGDLYIPEDYAMKTFGITAMPLPGTGKSVLLNDTLYSMAQKLSSLYSYP